VSKGEFRFNVLRGRAAAWRGARKPATPRRAAPGQPKSGALPEFGFPAAGLADALPCAALVLDESRRIVAANRKLADLLGLGPDFFVAGEAFADFARRAALGGDSGLLALGDLIPARDDPVNIAESRIQISSKSPLEARACRADNGQVLITLSAPTAGRAAIDNDIASRILENLPGAVLRLNIRPDGETRVLYASPRSSDTIGMPAERLTDPATDFRALILEEDRATLDGAIQDRGPDSGHVDVTFRILVPGRSPFWVRAVGFLSSAAEDGRLLDARLIDIEDRMRVAEERRHFSMLLDNIVENIPFTITVRDAESDNIVFVNRAGGETLGLDRHSLRRLTDDKVFPPGVERERRRIRREVATTGEPRAMPEAKVILPNAAPQILQTRAYPMTGPDGRVRHVLSISEPLAERRAAEEELRNSQIRLREAIESFSDGLALYDAEDRLVLCNRRYCAIWPGIAEVAVPGTPFDTIVRKYAEATGMGDRAERFVRERIREHRTPPSTADMSLPSGRWVQVSSRRTGDGGVVVICSDVTALKEREEGLRKGGREALEAKEAAESANRSKSNFLANMSHELRTPLNAVIGFSEIIKGAMLGPDAIDHYRAYAKDIHDSGRHLLALINDILDMSKIEAGKLELFEEPVKIQDAVETSFRLVRERAEKGRLTLKTEIPDDLPQLRADLRKVKQILINLVGNAVKFTPEGGEVTVAARIADDGDFLLEVRDTGIGISEDDLKVVVEPFGQADTGLDREYEGTGLGLTLTKALAELHGGTFHIESRHGTTPTGTIVRLTFPASRVLR